MKTSTPFFKRLAQALWVGAIALCPMVAKAQYWADANNDGILDYCITITPDSRVQVGFDPECCGKEYSVTYQFWGSANTHYYIQGYAGGQWHILNYHCLTNADLVTANWPEGQTCDTYGSYRCVAIGQPVSWPAGTATQAYVMPSYIENGQTFAKSTLTIGVYPDGTVHAVASGNRWFSGPSWLNGYMTNPEWMADAESDEDVAETLIFGFVPGGPALPHIINGVRVVSQNPGAVAAAAETAVLTSQQALFLVRIYMVFFAQQVLLNRQPNNVVSYVTYEKLHPVNQKVYVGRTAGRGTPLVVLGRRDAAHAAVRPDYDAAIMHSSTVWDGLTFRGYAGMRGREQQAIDFHRDRSQSTDVFEFSGNAINGVSPSNDAALTYWLTSNADFGGLTNYRGFTTTGEVPSQDRIPLAPPFSRAPITLP